MRASAAAPPGASAKWESDPDLTQGTVCGSSGLIGGTIGYNSQTLGRFVLGEEFDFSWRGPTISPFRPPPACPTCALTSNWVSTARLRFGYAIGTFMPYVTGGMSMSDFSRIGAGQPFGTNNNVTFNWMAGSGLEFIVAGPWSGKAGVPVRKSHPLCLRPECNGPPST